MSIIRLTILLFVCLSSTSQQGAVATVSRPCVCWVSKYTHAAMKERKSAKKKRERERASPETFGGPSVRRVFFKKREKKWYVLSARHWTYQKFPLQRAVWLPWQLEPYLASSTFFLPTHFSHLPLFLFLSLSRTLPFLQLHKGKLTFWCWTLILFQSLSLSAGFILFPAGNAFQSTMLGRGCWSAGVFGEH